MATRQNSRGSMRTWAKPFAPRPRATWTMCRRAAFRPTRSPTICRRPRATLYPRKRCSFAIARKGAPPAYAMTQDEIRSLFAFNAWANHRTLEACAALTPAQFIQAAPSSFPNVRDTLHHIMGVEWLYWERFQGRSPTELLPGETFADVAAIAARWQDIKKKLEDLVRSP